jgi:hypothetical protein
MVGLGSELLEASGSMARQRMAALTAATCDAIVAGAGGDLDRAWARAERMNADLPQRRHLTYRDVQAAHRRHLMRQAPKRSALEGARALVAAVKGEPTGRRRPPFYCWQRKH